MIGTLLALSLAFALDFGANSRQIPLDNNQANELFKAGNHKEALELYLKAYENDPQNGALAYNIGNVYAALGQKDKAAEFLDKATKAKNVQARNQAHFNLGNLELSQQKFQEAANHYIDYLQHQPDDIEAKRNLELALRQMQQQQNDKSDKQQDKKDQNQKDQDPQQDSQKNDPNDKQDQKDQKDQKPGDSKDQDAKDQDSKNQDSKSQDSKDQKGKDQDAKDQKDPQQAQQDQKDSKDQNAKDAEQKQGEKGQQAQKGDKDPMDPNVKRQILDALDQQEQAQQKEFQQRKTGKVVRRAKDW